MCSSVVVTGQFVHFWYGGQVEHVTGISGEFHYESLKIQKDKQKVKILLCE